MVTMVPASHPQSVKQKEELLLEHVLHLLESVVSSPSPVVEAAVPTTPMPSSLPTPQALMMILAPTPSVKPTQTSAN